MNDLNLNVFKESLGLDNVETQKVINCVNHNANENFAKYLSYRIFEYAKSYFVTPELQEVEQILESHSASLINPDYRGSEDQIELSRILSKFALKLLIKNKSEEKKYGFVPLSDNYNELINNFIHHFKTKINSTDPNNTELYRKHEDIFVEFIVQHAFKNTSINQKLIDLGDDLTLFNGIKEPGNILKIATMHVPLSFNTVDSVLKNYKDILSAIIKNAPPEKKDQVEIECKNVLIEILKLTGVRFPFYPNIIPNAFHSYEIDDPYILFEIVEKWPLNSKHSETFDHILLTLKAIKDNATREKDEAKISKCEKTYVKLLELAAKQLPVYFIHHINNLETSEETIFRLAAQILQSHSHEPEFINEVADDLAAYAHNASILKEVISVHCPTEFSLILDSLNAHPDVQLGANEISWLTQTFSKLSPVPAAPSSNQLAPAVWLKIFQCKNPEVRQNLTNCAFNILQDPLKLKNIIVQSKLLSSANTDEESKYSQLLTEMINEDTFTRPNIVQVLKRIEIIENPDLAQP